MVNDDPGRPMEGQPLDLVFRPSIHPLLPVEVVTRSEIHDRIAATSKISSRQRLSFNLLIVCVNGEGVHHVDFEPISMRPRTLLHVHPGQVQEYQFTSDFDAYMVVYRADLHRTFIPGRRWFPGSDLPTRWDLSEGDCSFAVESIQALRTEQERFDGSPAYTVLMESLLATFLARLSLLGGETIVSRLPEAYIEFRQYLENHLQERPSVTRCASELGYSTRTLDRACLSAVGHTAKHVLDDRVAFEIRRILTHTDTPVTAVGSAFGFSDASSFSKFVRRHFDESPSDLRSANL